MNAIKDSRRRLLASWICAGIAILLLYGLFQQRYQMDYIDNAWTMSWAYNWWSGQGVYDQVFGFLDGDGGTALFSRTFVFLYGAVAELFGWTRGVGIFVSSLLILGAGCLWYLIIRELGYRKAVALSFVVVMLVLEAFYGVSQKIRVDALTFFLTSVSFFLVLKRRYLPAGLVLGIAFENHPYALSGGFWILAYLFSIRQEIRADVRAYLIHAAWFLLGLVLGLAYWYVLHHASLGDLGDLGDRIGGNPLIGYFFKFQYSWRHWPELVAILAALIIFMAKRMGRKHPFVLPFVLAVLVVSVLLPRGNYHYVVFLYPAIVLLLIIVADELKFLWILVLGVLFFQLPQYAWLFWNDRAYSHRAVVEDTRERLEAENQLIYGPPTGWFALYDKNYKAYGYFNRAGIEPEHWPRQFLVLEDENFSRWYGQADIARSVDIYEGSLHSEWTRGDGVEVRLWQYSRTAE